MFNSSGRLPVLMLGGAGVDGRVVRVGDYEVDCRGNRRLERELTLCRGPESYVVSLRLAALDRDLETERVIWNEKYLETLGRLYAATVFGREMVALSLEDILGVSSVPLEETVCGPRTDGPAQFWTRSSWVVPLHCCRQVSKPLAQLACDLLWTHGSRDGYASPHVISGAAPVATVLGYRIN